MEKTVLVTGGAGFVGSHITDGLIKKGYSVAVVDNLSTGKKENINQKANFYRADIRDSDVSEIFKKEKPKAVFHYAAQIDVRKSMADPVSDANINILGTLNILENCKKFKVKKIIFASSVGVYGEVKKLPIKENNPPNPISPYPITKLTVEKYLSYYQEQGVDFVSLRYSNIYGPRQSAEGEGGVVAIFTDRILNGENPIIYGNGRQTRDFLYVEDAAAAAIKALKAPPSSIFNIGANKEISINNLLKLLSLIANKKIKPIYKPLRRGEIIKSRVDFSKAKKEISWEPKYNLEKGLKETLKWHQ